MELRHLLALDPKGPRGSQLGDAEAPLAGARTVSASSVVDGQAAADVAGYTVIDAASVDDAVQLVRGHAFLARGGSLQVSESVAVGG